MSRQTEKRDALIEFEKKYQQEWADAKLFEFEAPTENHDDTPKFFGTAAYPYMNGTLHAGHAFTMSKIGTLRKETTFPDNMPF